MISFSTVMQDTRYGFASAAPAIPIFLLNLRHGITWQQLLTVKNSHLRE